MAASLRKLHKVHPTVGFRSNIFATCGGARTPFEKISAQSRTISSEVSVPKEVDVVVIGGGVIGCSTLYHLAKLGITNTVLLEAHKLTSGTTWHTAGLISCLRSNEAESQLIRITRDLLTRLEDETDVNPGFINNGTIMVADSKARMDEYRRLMTTGRALGIDSSLLDPKETKDMYPLMKVDDLLGSLYIPSDGTMDPAGYCTAMVKSAKRGGAKVIENCPVTDVRTIETFLGGRKVSEIHTSHGVIKTNILVNATGGWGNHIANMVGLDLPLTVYEHSYVITDRIEGIENMPNVRETKTSAYLKLQGDALAIGGFEHAPVRVDHLATDSPFMLYELNWGAFGELLEGALQRVPVLAHTGIKSTISGPETFTPDHCPIMGMTTTKLTRRLTSHLQSGSPKQHHLQHHNAILTRNEIEKGTTILATQTDARRLAILEALYIKEKCPRLNTQFQDLLTLPSARTVILLPNNNNNSNNNNNNSNSNNSDNNNVNN